MNTFAALETWFAQANLSMSQISDEADTAKARAEAAEQALEEARREAAMEAEKTRTAERRTNSALSAACGLENRISSLLEELQAQGLKVTEAEKKASEAEAKWAEGEKRIAEVETEAAEWKGKAAEAEAKMATLKEQAAGAEARAVESDKKAAEAVTVFRQSASFKEEIVRGTAYAFNLGFRECKRKMMGIYNNEGMGDVEPDEPEEAVSSPSEIDAQSPGA